MSEKGINATHYELIPALPDRKASEVIVNSIIETNKNSPAYSRRQGNVLDFHTVA